VTAPLAGLNPIVENRDSMVHATYRAHPRGRLERHSILRSTI